VGPLVFFIFHGVAGRVLDTTPDDAADWVCGMLTEAIGAACPEPTAVAVTSWATAPYSFGAYSYSARRSRRCRSCRRRGSAPAP
jgi:hypothetical protein